MVISDDGIESYRPFPAAQRPALRVRVRLLRHAGLGRERPLGLRRAQAHGPAPGRRRAPCQADVVVPVPDFERAGGARFRPGRPACPSRWASSATTTSGAPSSSPPRTRARSAVRMKYSPNRAVLAGKRVILIDDSIVRGTTSVKVVRMVREAGAKEVHLRSASPPIKYPDFYGIDMPDRDKLLAAQRGRSRRWPSIPRGRQPGLPVGRGPLLGHGRRTARSRAARSSPTTTSPANIPPACSTARSPRAATSRVERQLSFLVDA